ncbi:MAG: Gfo/Idh/MocA family protein [Candidatus Zipacnadales bacterium]
MKEQLRVGIVGAAGRGKSFFNAFRAHPHACLHAVCDINEEGVRTVATENDIERVYLNYEEMLEAGEIEVVVIGTPMPLHAPQAIAALERGVHVLSEVPAAVSLAECQELVRAAKRSTATYMMAENYCYIRTNVLVGQMARAGLFGRLYYGEGAYIHELKGLNEITKWRRRWQTGINGVTYPTHSLGPLVQWFEERVVSVCCFGSGHHYLDPRGDYYEQEDSVHMACRMEGGGLVNIRLDMLSNRPHNMTYYSLQGTEGCYEAPRSSDERHRVWVQSRHVDPNEWHDLAEFEEEFLPEQWLHPSPEALRSGHWGGDYFVVADFLDAIVEGRQPPIDIHSSLDMTLPGLISQQSIAEGSVWLPVPDSREW